MLKWALIGASALLAACLILVAAVHAGFLRGPLIRAVESRAHRAIEVAGPMSVQIFSRHPGVTAERVTIHNPPWTPAGVAADIGRLSLSLDLPGLHRSFGIARLELDSARLHLQRDERGRANWQWSIPTDGGGGGLPLVRSLSMQSARVQLSDARRHLEFDGTVTARDDDTAARALRIDGSGQLNGRETAFEINGDPLNSTRRGQPYHFRFAEDSSGSRLQGAGDMPRPFDFTAIEAAFSAAGADLKDLYYLTGVTLPNTGAYRLSGATARRGTQSVFRYLVVKSGASEVHAELSIDSSQPRPMYRAAFFAPSLRTADIGLRAAGRQPALDPATDLLLSSASFKPKAVRRGDAAVSFQARHVQIGRIELTAVSGSMSIVRGIVKVAPLTADVMQGKLNAVITIDATTDRPRSQFDVRIAGAQLGLLPRKDAKPAPIEGPLQARATGIGSGTSVHQIAASAEGTLTAVLPHGAIREALAESAGVDLRGIGLLAAKDERETSVRCAVASFSAHDGVLSAQRLILDTAPVLVSGEGRIALDTESLDLTLRGHPKKVRLLRLRAPILVRGTLRHPAVSIKAGPSAGQAAEAVALGVVLTPLAAVLAFVDPGLAKDVDCAAMMSAAEH